MTLKGLCIEISCNKANQLKENDPIGLRIMCPEYSMNAKDIKTYPLPKQKQLFALCWNIQANQRLYATIKPSEQAFTYSCGFSSGSRTQPHTHEYIELAYVVDGEFSQRILGKDITFKKGELCLIDKNCLHQDYLVAKPTIILFFGITNEMFDEIMSSHIATEKITSFLQSALLKQKKMQQYLHFKPHHNACTDMENCLLSLLNELMQHDEASAYICKGFLIRIFRLLSVNYDFYSSKEFSKEMNWLLFEVVIDYIKEHYFNITIKDLVEHFHFQEDYFNRLIKSQTGDTYSNYLQNIRLQEAEKLLKTTDMSIEKIANAVGYLNKGYFYKIFIERYGMTPAKLRKQNKSITIG